MRVRSVLWGAALVAGFLAVPLAAGNPNLEGKWKVNHEKTEMKNFPMLIVEISVSEAGVEFKETQPDPKGDIVNHMILPPGGEEGSYAGLRGKALKCAGKIEDGTLTIDYEQIVFRKGKPVILLVHEVYTLSPDGESLSMSHEDTLAGRLTVWPRPVVFDRVPFHETGNQSMTVPPLSR